jgi:hypothetical protein
MFDGESDAGPDPELEAGPDAGRDAAPPDPDAEPAPGPHPGWCIERVDRLNDGRIDQITTQIWEDGRPIRLEVDVDANGAPNTIAALVHDDDGRLAERRWDYGMNNFVDKIERWTYDAFGRVSVYDVDEPPGGIVDLRYTYFWEDEPGFWHQFADRFADGVPEERWDWAATSQDPFIIEGIRTEPATGRETHRWTILHDGQRRRVKDRIFTLNPEILLKESEYGYDPVRGDLIRVQADDPVGGLIESVTTYEYDCWP